MTENECARVEVENKPKDRPQNDHVWGDHAMETFARTAHVFLAPVISVCIQLFSFFPSTSFSSAKLYVHS